MYRALCILPLFFGLTLTVQAECNAKKPLANTSIEDLQSFVNDNSFTSIECFIASLPESIRGVRSYVKDSLSLQEASSMNPRAVVAAADGGFFLTFNGHKRQKGFDEVEVFAVDNLDHPTKWVTATIAKRGKILAVQLNPKKCTACHGDPVRPIWGAYPDWPNMYGSVDDWMPDPKDLAKGSPYYAKDIVPQDNAYGASQTNNVRLTPEKVQLALSEREQFLKFRARAKEHPRYKHLEQASDPRSPVYPYTEVYRGRNLALRPNLLIGNLLTMRHTQILRNRLANNSLHQKLGNSFAHYELCRPYDGDHHKVVHDRFSAISKLSLGQPMVYPITKGDPYQAYTRLFGILPHEKTLLFVDTTGYLNAVSNPYFSGTHLIVGELADYSLVDLRKSWSNLTQFVNEEPYKSNYYAIIEEIKKKSPSLTYYQSVYLGEDLHLFYDEITGRNWWNFGDITDGKAFMKVLCGELKMNSEIELTQLSEKDYPAKPASVKRAGPWPEAVDSCVQCHDGPDRVGPAIPFHSPEKLRDLNHSFRSNLGWGDLFNAIESAIDPFEEPAHQNGYRMPLGRRPLYKHERQQLMDWVTGQKSL